MKIISPLGMHARPASELVKMLRGCSSKVTFSFRGKQADASSMLSLLSLGLKCGSEVDVSAEGPDEFDVLAEVEEFILHMDK
ncbi:MAG: HPr family phosphocarrier protein [Bacteroidales bacterium]|nr:HPr family phosphocarrier protein [Bacteroidales bacterium]MCI2122534.1 HPr family phosphocarrier protein [Bacteroidales bacterium]MCI2146286.1 HPr family phosphocarrier protein [Bacteroidales bacterium]